MKFIVLSTVFLFWGCNGSRPCDDPPEGLPACSGECEDYVNYGSDITAYVVRAESKTPSGIVVDTSGIPVDLESIDRLTRELEQCLRLTIDPDCLVVKIAPDWYVSECTNTELFPCDFPKSWCDQIRPADNPCPCNCAGVIQNGNIIIVTPNLRAYKHELIHVVSGLSDAEIDSREDLTQCSRPVIGGTI